MTNDQFTAILAERVMGWKAAPDRFVKVGRSWIPRWRFRPLTELADAFQLLDYAAEHYTLTRSESLFAASVQIGSRAGCAADACLARAISVAVGRAFGLDLGK